MPFDNIAKRHFDSGDYPEALRRAIEAIGFDSVRERQKRGEPDGRRIGIGFAMYCRAGRPRHQRLRRLGHSVRAGLRAVAGALHARWRRSRSRIGAHSHGQGLETTLSQVAHSILGVPHDRIRLVHGDTAETPYSTGTWGSRCMIMSGGAVAAACDELAERVLKIGAGLLQARREDVRIESGFVVGPSGRIAVPEIARIWYRRPQDLPADVDPRGLELTAGYKAKRDTGTFSYAAHAAVVAVMPDTGEVEILDYVVVEDGGVLVNPMIVDGQIWGGAAQGIGTALYEEMPFDAQGQPLASTLSDYLLPGPTEVPDIRILHMETPSPYTRFGQKGIGEGGAIAPPAAITNAVNDALKDFGVELLVSPITPRRIVEAIERAAPKAARRMKPVAFDYVRPAGIDEAVGAARRQRRMQRFWLAGRRSVRCSICVSPSPRCWLISRASPSWRRCTRMATRSRSAPRSRMPPSRMAASPIRPAAFSRGSRAALPTAPCARAEPSAAASPTPTRRPTGCRA